MATFYLFPSRQNLGKCFAAFLSDVFPGLNWDNGDHSDLAEALAGAGASQPGVYVVFREDLEDGFTEEELCQAFGAERGDEIIEILPWGSGVSRWKISLLAKSA